MAIRDDSKQKEKARRSVATGHQLCFPPEARPMLTDFRVYVLQTLYEFGRKELGDSLKSASVSVYYDHYEPVPPVLVLGIVADIGGEEFGRVHRALVESIVLEEQLWSEAEKADYRKMIHCELVPMRV